MEVSTVIAEATHALEHVDQWVKPETVRWRGLRKLILAPNGMPHTTHTPPPAGQHAHRGYSRLECRPATAQGGRGAWPSLRLCRLRCANAVLTSHPATLPLPLPAPQFIISPWNYPLQLILNPLVAAVAAGNTAVLKPSECSPHCAALVSELVPKYLDASAIQVVQGAVPETTELLKQQADHIVYTGNPMVAKIVMRAAAEHLTPVTLELGGKSPAFITADADLDAAARRIVQGRWANNGQTCVASDYLLVDSSIKASFLGKLKAALLAAYGENPQQSDSYGRIVNTRHWDRIKALIDSAKVGEEGSSAKLVAGGSHDREDLYIAPTIIADPDPACALMQEEIFGPVLPVLGYDRLEDAVAFVNSGDRPLALYVFCKDAAVADKVLAHTTSGSACVNDCLVQNGNPHLPFGGVGTSGMGAYHGKWGFDEFSHCKAVMHHPSYPLLDPAERYAPYNNKNIPMLRLLLELDSIPTWVQVAGAVVATGAAAAIASAVGAL